MNLFSPPAATQGESSPIGSVPSTTEGERRPLLIVRVGRVLLRRTRYVLRFIYWTCKHRSTANAAWVCEYEGYKWN